MTTCPKPDSGFWFARWKRVLESWRDRACAHACAGRRLVRLPVTDQKESSMAVFFILLWFWLIYFLGLPAFVIGLLVGLVAIVVTSLARRVFPPGQPTSDKRR
jgi:hypothetical protein